MLSLGLASFFSVGALLNSSAGSTLSQLLYFPRMRKRCLKNFYQLILDTNELDKPGPDLLMILVWEMRIKIKVYESQNDSSCGQLHTTRQDNSLRGDCGSVGRGS